MVRYTYMYYVYYYTPYTFKWKAWNKKNLNACWEFKKCVQPKKQTCLFRYIRVCNKHKKVLNYKNKIKRKRHLDWKSKTRNQLLGISWYCVVKQGQSDHGWRSPRAIGGGKEFALFQCQLPLIHIFIYYVYILVFLHINRENRFSIGRAAAADVFKYLGNKCSSDPSIATYTPKHMAIVQDRMYNANE